MVWYLDVLRKYAVFNGRAGRKEYWWSMLVSAAIYGVFLWIDLSNRSLYDITFLSELLNMDCEFYLTSGIYSIAVFLPFLGVTVRRLHDVGLSGWAALIVMIPFLGPFILFTFVIQGTAMADNKYGPFSKNYTPGIFPDS